VIPVVAIIGAWQAGMFAQAQASHPISHQVSSPLVSNPKASTRASTRAPTRTSTIAAPTAASNAASSGARQDVSAANRGQQSSAEDRSACERDFKPQSGQSGKDVIWVPTSDRLVARMLKMASVSPQDLVFDLGAGDGKIAIAAARDFGARAVGVEYNPDMAKLAACYARAEGVSDRAQIIQGDIFETDFSKATVVTLYLLPELNMRLRPMLLKMKPGTRVVSHSFLMEDWEPDDRSMTEDGQAYMWVVPAQVEGTWLFRRQDGRDRFDIHLEQTFQFIKGTAGPRAEVMRASLSGRNIILAYGDGLKHTRIVGEVDGDQITAKLTRAGKTYDYTATRSHARR